MCDGVLVIAFVLTQRRTVVVLRTTDALHEGGVGAVIAIVARDRRALDLAAAAQAHVARCRRIGDLLVVLERAIVELAVCGPGTRGCYTVHYFLKPRLHTALVHRTAVIAYLDFAAARLRHALYVAAQLLAAIQHAFLVGLGAALQLLDGRQQLPAVSRGTWSRSEANIVR